MADLLQLRAMLGPEGMALGGVAVVTTAWWLVLVGFTVARIRLPAPLWWLPALFLTLAGVGVGAMASAPLTEALAAADALRVQELATAARAAYLAPRALGLFLAALHLAASALAVAIISSLRLEHPYQDWVSGLLPLTTGSAVCAVAAAFGAAMGASLLVILTLVAVSLCGVISAGLTALRTSLSRSERANVGARRALVVSMALGSVVALGLAWRDALQSVAPDAQHRALLTATAFALAVAAAGLPTLSNARGAMTSLRSVVGTLITTALLGLTVVAGWGLRLDPIVLEAARGGAIARIPEALWTRLPRSIDLADVEEPAEPIDGSCLIREAPTGWEAEPLYQAISPEAHVARNVTNPDAVHELDRSPGCPATLGPLEGPLAASEIGVVALDAQRAGTALAGWEWFRDRGSLRVLVQPDPVETAHLTEQRVRARSSSIPFLWERPPAVKPPEDYEPGVWDESWAAQLPVTLLEGPYPVLVAGGIRSRLPPGEMGIDTLQLALDSQPPHRRDLVLVPRKTWTVQDLVGFCLAVHQQVDGARCVVRPETPARWSIRTRLPLPW